MHTQRGLTLIELVAVVIVLGILSVILVPKFLSVDKDARISVLKGTHDSVRNSSLQAYVKAKSQGIPPNGQLTLDDGSKVRLKNYYPHQKDINKVIVYTKEDYQFRNGRFSLVGAQKPKKCAVLYESAQPNQEPAVTLITTGC